MNAQERYRWACETPSDIAGLIPILYKYGCLCDKIVELGVRGGNSTSAWLMAAPKTLNCYDQAFPECFEELSRIAVQQKTHFTFHHTDTSKVQIEATDLLFIDTLHTEEQVKAELRNADKVSKFILLHDTDTWGITGEGGGRGINFAISDFLSERPDWIVKEILHHDNGLTVLKRI